MNLPFRDDESTEPAELGPTTLSPRAKRVGHALPYITLPVCLFILLIGYRTLSHTDKSNAILSGQSQQSTITACRAPYRSAIDAATLQSAKAESHRFDIFTTLIVTSVRGHITPQQSSAFTRDLLLAQADVAKAQATLDIAVQANASSAVMSGRHPRMFLAACHRITPYKSCREAARLGPTPLREGDPGFNPKLDRDGDGVACE